LKKDLNKTKKEKIRMLKIRENKNLKHLLEKAAFLGLAVLVVAFGAWETFAQEAPAIGPSMPGQVDISAFIVNSEGESVQNGKYQVRFALYTVDREEIDPYPSNSDSAQRV
jgi:uncharacterized membrane protein